MERGRRSASPKLATPAGHQPRSSKSKSKSPTARSGSGAKVPDALVPFVKRKRKPRPRGRRKGQTKVTFADQAAPAAAATTRVDLAAAAPTEGATRLRERDPTPVKPKASIIKIPSVLPKATAAPPRRGESPLPALSWGFSDSPARPRRDASASPRSGTPKKARSRSRSPREHQGNDGATKGLKKVKGKGKGKGFAARANGKGKQRSRSNSRNRKGAGAARKDGGAPSTGDRRK